MMCSLLVTVLSVASLLRGGAMASDANEDDTWSAAARVNNMISAATMDDLLAYCAWTAWSAWSPECDCRINQRARTRTALVRGTCGADKQRQYGPCNCCTLFDSACMWGAWSEWTPCDCTTATQTQTRKAHSINAFPVYLDDERVRECKCQ